MLYLQANDRDGTAGCALRFSFMRQPSGESGIDTSLIAGFVLAILTLGFLVFGGKSDLAGSNDLNVNIKPTETQTPATSKG
jgi:hypothetical protein